MKFSAYLDDPVIKRLMPALHPVDIDGGEDKPVRDGQRQASVLMPLIPRKAGWTVLLTQRPETMPRHPGQISFPGGRVEPGEMSMHAALRETHEEVGIPKDEIKILGRLDSFNAGSDFRVTPWLGIIWPHAEIIPCPREVDDAFEVPLDFFMNPDNHSPRTVSYKAKDFTLYDMPYDEPEGIHRNVWGMTAMMLYRLYRRAYVGDFAHPDMM